MRIVSNESRKSGDWSGSASFTNSLKLAREGWKEGREHVEKLRANYATLLGSCVLKPIIENSVTGFAPDVGAFLCGSPESMFSRTFVETATPGKIIRFVFSLEAHANCTPQTYMNRGALILALADALENGGYSCEIIADSTANARGEIDAHVITLKKAGEPIEIDRMAFAMAHVSMLRRLIFACNEQNPAFISNGYGSSVDAPKESQGDIYFSCAFTGSDVDDSKIVQWAKRQLAPLGITFDE